MMRIEFAPLASDAEVMALEREWRALEEMADGSFFQSWTWIGCRLRSRFTSPFVLRAIEDGTVVGLALFNRRGPRLWPTLWLHEVGTPSEDSVFIEHNGPLLARGCHALLRPMLQTALRHGRLMLSGVSDAVRDVAQSLGVCRVLATRPAPYVALNGASAAEWLAGLGPSTRYQLRRSRRRYEAEGPLVLRLAATTEEGLAFLNALAALHQQRWTARGERGAFAEPAFVAFHHALVARGLPRGEVELLRVSKKTRCGTSTIGYLYNFIWHRKLYAYQSGFNYMSVVSHEKPGLTCHHAAIETAISSGCDSYDFLAGWARYKTSLGTASMHLHWLELAGALTPHGLKNRIRDGLSLLAARAAPAATKKV